MSQTPSVEASRLHSDESAGQKTHDRILLFVGFQPLAWHSRNRVGNAQLEGWAACPGAGLHAVLADPPDDSVCRSPFGATKTSSPREEPTLPGGQGAPVREFLPDPGGGGGGSRAPRPPRAWASPLPAPHLWLSQRACREPCTWPTVGVQAAPAGQWPGWRPLGRHVAELLCNGGIRGDAAVVTPPAVRRPLASGLSGPPSSFGLVLLSHYLRIRHTEGIPMPSPGSEHGPQGLPLNAKRWGIPGDPRKTSLLLSPPRTPCVDAALGAGRAAFTSSVAGALLPGFFASLVANLCYCNPISADGP